jgi:nitrogen fixation protein NifU and related proteins
MSDPLTDARRSRPESSAEIAALDQEIILDHYRRPRNKGALEKADATVEMRNPLCGDEISLEVAFNGDGVSDLKFSGRGCSISQASASMMTQLVKGKSTEEINAIRKQFRDLMLGNAPDADDSRLGSLRALSGVARFPARVKCALLAWNALESALAERASRRSESVR